MEVFSLSVSHEPVDRVQLTGWWRTLLYVLSGRPVALAYDPLMRLFLAIISMWVVFGGLAALLHWLIGPMVVAHGEVTIANAETADANTLGTVFNAALWGPIVSKFLPLLFLAGALGGTVNLLKSPRRRSA